MRLVIKAQNDGAIGRPQVAMHRYCHFFVILDKYFFAKLIYRKKFQCGDIQNTSLTEHHMLYATLP